MYVVPVAWLVHIATGRGAESPDVRAGLAAAGLAPRILDGGTDQVSASRFASFIEEAARVAGEEFHGLDLGLVCDVRASGIAAYTSLACETSADYAFTAVGDEAFFRIETRSPQIRMRRHAIEFKVALVAGACLTWVGPALRPKEAQFSFTRANPREAGRRLGSPARYAFRRWTGQSPSRFRAEAGAPGA